MNSAEKLPIVPVFIYRYLDKNNVRKGPLRRVVVTLFFAAFLVVTFLGLAIVLLSFLKMSQSAFCWIYATTILFCIFRNYLALPFRTCSLEKEKENMRGILPSKARRGGWRPPIIRRTHVDVKMDDLEKKLTSFFEQIWQIFFAGPVRTIISTLIFVIAMCFIIDGPKQSKDGAHSAYPLTVEDYSQSTNASSYTPPYTTSESSFFRGRVNKWNNLTTAEKIATAKRMAAISRHGASAQYFYDGFEEFYDTNDSAILSQSIEDVGRLLDAGSSILAPSDRKY